MGGSCPDHDAWSPLLGIGGECVNSPGAGRLLALGLFPGTPGLWQSAFPLLNRESAPSPDCLPKFQDSAFCVCSDPATQAGWFQGRLAAVTLACHQQSLGGSWKKNSPRLRDGGRCLYSGGAQIHLPKRKQGHSHPREHSVGAFRAQGLQTVDGMLDSGSWAGLRESRGLWGR